MNFAKIAIAAATLVAMPAVAHAQEEAAPAAAEVTFTQGATVMGNDGNPIGTVTEVLDQGIVVDTGTHQIPLPRDLFSENETSLTLNITQAELDASYAEQMAALDARLDAKLVEGTPVMTADMQPLGTVDMVEGENVVLALEGDERLTLGRNVFTVDANDMLKVRATKEQLEAAMNGGSQAAEG